MTIATWIRPRRPTINAIAVGSSSWPIAFVVAWFLWPDSTALVAPMDRISFALQLAVAPALFIALVMASCARLLDTDQAEDVFAGAESYGWKVNQRVLSNSIEQAAMFVPTLIGLSLRVDPAHTKILPILTTLWVTGRVFFWVGYRIKLPYRAVGFDWTFYSFAVAALWFVATLFA
jgi:uncharacterized membrane protein YecN with MAPEG domain